MATRYISTHVNQMYGMGISPTLVSNITVKIIPVIRDFQSRPLEAVYPTIFMDAIHFKVRKGNTVVSKEAYAAIGVNLEWKKMF